MKAKRTNPAGIIGLLLLGAAGVYAVGVYIKKTPESQNVPPALHRSDKPAAQAEPNQDKPRTSVKIVTPSSSRGNLRLDEANTDVPEGEDPVLFAVNGFFQASHITPANAKALRVEVDSDGVAQID